jgi:hypothetical protein
MRREFLQPALSWRFLRCLWESPIIFTTLLPLARLGAAVTRSAIRYGVGQALAWSDLADGPQTTLLRRAWPTPMGWARRDATDAA